MKLKKKRKDFLYRVAGNIYNQRQIDNWDGEKIRVWTDNNEIVNLKPVNGDIKAETTVDFTITSNNVRKANKMFKEANEIFEGSDCKVRFEEDKREASILTISCKGDRKFDTSDYENAKELAKKIDELIQDTRNENREYVKQVKQVDMDSESDLDE